MMRGVYCDGASVRLRRDLPAPEPGPGEVVLKVRAIGVCETDLQLVRGYMGFRGVLGHEFIGETADGRRVTAEINNPCRRCDTCHAGRPQHCPNRTVLGIFNHDGAMAERVSVPEANLHAVPDSIGDRAAVFIEPLAAALRITEQIDLGPEASLAILGDGKLGLLCSWVARLAGARVSLIGKHRAKLGSRSRAKGSRPTRSTRPPRSRVRSTSWPTAPARQLACPPPWGWSGPSARSCSRRPWPGPTPPTWPRSSSMRSA